MARFIINLLSFICLFALVDTIGGKVCDYLATNAKSGETYIENYIENEMSDDILIMGSSRAKHHYNPKVITDSLNMTCVNLGRDGMGIIYNYGQLALFVDRYKPKAIIYEYTPHFDYDNSVDNRRFFSKIRRLYGKNAIVDRMVQSNYPFAKVKMLSKLWRYNDEILRVIQCYLQKEDFGKHKGFDPRGGVMKYDMPDTEKYSSIVMDSVKVEYIDKFIDLCKSKDITVYIYISPNYNLQKNSAIDYITTLCKNKSISFYNHANDSLFLGNKELFYDSSHMNYEGADIYTKSIAHELKEYISQ